MDDKKTQGKCVAEPSQKTYSQPIRWIMKRRYYFLALLAAALGFLGYFFGLRRAAVHPPSLEAQTGPSSVASVATTEGPNVLVDPHDPAMGTSLKKTRAWEEPLLGIAEAVLAQTKPPKRQRLLHLGASTGFLEVALGPKLSKGDRIVALEPLPHLGHLFLKNIKAHGLEKKVSLIPIAASLKEGSLEYCEDEQANTQNGLSNARCHALRKAPLDALQLGLPTLVISNIEGSEPEALLGARKLLKKAKYPPLVIKWDPGMMALKESPKERFLSYLKLHYRHAYHVEGSRHSLRLTALTWKQVALCSSPLIVLFTNRRMPSEIQVPLGPAPAL